ncbi:MAG: hypothetical protein KIS92_23815 [Planctomycetota bacterium]|nr:hypothetical protein [Planctomycetota bacterium]
MSDKLGEMLVRANLITESQLKTALETQQQVGGKLGVILHKLRYIPEDTMVTFLGQQLNLPTLQIRELVVSPKVSALMDVELLEKHQMLPIRRREDVLLLAVADPMDFNAVDEVRFLTGLRTELAVASRTNIQKAIDYYFHGLPCPELATADEEVRTSGEHAAVSGGRAGVRVPPAQVLQALVDLLIDKKVITKEELAAMIGRAK